MSFIAFLNGVLGWLGELVGVKDASLENIFGTIFRPLAFVMGVPWDESYYVGKLIGIKTIVNEFVAYQKLGEFIDGNFLSSRSAAIATYAICGFANPSSMGIMIGTLSAMVPDKRGVITSVAFRAFITGSIVCFMTASIGGTDDEGSFLMLANPFCFYRYRLTNGCENLQQFRINLHAVGNTKQTKYPPSMYSSRKHFVTEFNKHLKIKY